MAIQLKRLQGITPQTSIDRIISMLQDNIQTTLTKLAVQLGGVSGTIKPPPIVTDFAPYTPTFSGFGTPTNLDFSWRRVGDSVYIHGFFTPGTTTAVIAEISLPSGLVIDPVKFNPSPSFLHDLGTIHSVRTDGGHYTLIAYGGASVFNIGLAVTTQNQLSPQNANSMFVAGDTISFFTAGIPIQGWSVSA